jgi:hypothetical protein
LVQPGFAERFVGQDDKFWASPRFAHQRVFRREKAFSFGLHGGHTRHMNQLGRGVLPPASHYV